MFEGTHPWIIKQFTTKVKNGERKAKTWTTLVEDFIVFVNGPKHDKLFFKVMMLQLQKTDNLTCSTYTSPGRGMSTCTKVVHGWALGSGTLNLMIEFIFN